MAELHRVVVEEKPRCITMSAMAHRGPQINDIDFPRLVVYFRDYHYLAMAFPLSLNVSMSQLRELR